MELETGIFLGLGIGLLLFVLLFVFCCYLYRCRRNRRSETDRERVLDLHGMTVKEATATVKRDLTRTKKGRKLNIITGRGVHSPGGIPRIRPAVENLLNKMGISYTTHAKGGMLKAEV